VERSLRQRYKRRIKLKTWLFVPGNEPEKIEKALNSTADVVIICWEDAVAPNQKENARRVTQDVLSTVESCPRIVLRINSFATEAYTKDIEALDDMPISAVMLAKVSKPEEVLEVAEMGYPVIPLIESAFAIENAYQIAKAHRMVERLVLGTMDLMADLGAQWEPDGPSLHYLRSRILVAGQAAGLAGSIDGVYPLLNDLSGLHQEATTARKMGFAGKLLIHPRQIEVVHQVFSPTQEEIEEALMTIATFDEAVAAGRSAIRIGERMVDPPMVIWAQNVLRLAGMDTRNHIKMREKSQTR
jgi:citrate lyase subunit beta/citryl-CoA lyase